MSNLFGDMSTEGFEEAEDRLGGFQLFETDVYDTVVKAFYAGKANDAASQAKSITVIADIGGKEYRETFWVTTKEGKNYFLNKNDQTKKVALPGYQIVDDICLATTGKGLNELAFDDKVINVYNPEHKKEMPTNVKMGMAVVGQPVTLGIQKVLVNKQTKNSSGVYEDTPDSREENQIAKVFHTATRVTIVEAKAGKTAEFYDQWIKKNKGTTYDRRKIKDGATTGQNGRSGPPQGGGASKPTTSSLFGN